MNRGADSFNEALLNSWKTFRKKLPAGIGGYLDPREAFEKLIKKNVAAVLTELKESREALVLLSRMAAGASLEENEQQKLKQQLADLARVGAVVDHPHDGEKEGRHNAVGEHLQGRTTHTNNVHGGKAHRHQTHVADAGIGDQLFHILLLV